MNWLTGLFDPTGFVPRKECGAWTPEWIALHTGSDLFIWLAYLSIPGILLVNARRQVAAGLRTPLVLFALFILSCGFTHLIEAMMFEHPVYRLSGVMKLITAVVSWLTVFALVPLAPRVLARIGPPPAVVPATGTVAPVGPRWMLYLFAVLVGCLAVLCRYALDPVLEDQHPFALTLMAVILVSWYGGFLPGVVCTLVSGGLSAVLFLHPRGSGVIYGLPNQFGIGLYLFTGLGVAVLGQLQQTTRQRLLGQMTAAREATAALSVEKYATDRALAQLDALVRNAPYGIAFFDQELRYLRVNESFARVNGMPVEAHFGKRLTDALPDFPADVLGDYRAVLEGGPPLVGRLVHGGGRVWEVSAFQVPIDHDQMGLGVIGQDVTDRFRADERLRESEGRFRQLADAMPQIVFAARPDGHVDYFNRRWYEFTGFSDDGRTGDESWLAVHEPDALPRVHERWGEAVRTGEPYEIEYRLRRHDGVWRWHLGRANPVRDAAGQIVRWYGTNTDIDDQKRQEIELQEARRFSESVLHSLPGHLAVIDDRGDIVAVNESWWQFGEANGTPPGYEWVGRNYFAASLTDKAHGERAVAGIKAVARGDRGAFEMEYPCHGNGRERYFLLRANRFRGDGPVRLVITHENITDRVQAEREVRERASQLLQLTEGMPFLMWACRPTGECDYLSRQWVEYTGVPADRQIPYGWLDTLHPDDRDRTREVWQAAVAGQAEYDLEYRIRRHDGVYRWFAVRGIALRDQSGRIVRWYGACIDVDDRKQQADTLERLVAERTAELVQQQSFLDAILDNVAEGIVACDKDGQLKLFNAATRRMHGLPAEPLSAEHWSARYTLYEPDGVTPMGTEHVPLVRAWRGEVLRDVEMVIRADDPDHPERFVLCSGQPLTSPAGEVFGAVVSMRDVTEQREHEWQLLRTTAALKASNEDLEKFAYIASHDLQEPLRKIQAFGDRLVSKFRAELGQQGQDYLDRMLDSAGRMRKLIEDLLAFSRVSTRSRPPGPVDLTAVVRGVLADLEEQIRRTDGRVVCEPLPTLYADPAQLGQVFQNLIGNALKFHRPGVPPEVTVSAVEFARLPADAPPPAVPGDGWRITIADNGIGFEPAHAEKIFELFQRLHGRAKFEGTGLGLAIVKKIVTRHGATITARGTPGEGAVFVIDWPTHSGSEGP